MEHRSITTCTGDGYPLLLFAPGGMQSIAPLWRKRPGAPGVEMPWIDPTTELADQFRVVAMDQRNAGRSSAPITAADSGSTYTADHPAEPPVGASLTRATVQVGAIRGSKALRGADSGPIRVSKGLGPRSRPRPDGR
jgi:pimeloyl-ACP methyl ester carboxylesterase